MSIQSPYPTPQPPQASKLQVPLGQLVVPLGALIGGVGALLVLLGSIGPWATASALGFSRSVNGFDAGGGVYTLLSAFLAGAVFVAGTFVAALRRLFWFPLVAAGIGGIALIVVIIAMARVGEFAGRSSAFGVTVEGGMGWGLILAFLGTLAIIAGGGLAFLALRGETGPAPTPQYGQLPPQQPPHYGQPPAQPQQSYQPPQQQASPAPYQPPQQGWAPQPPAAPGQQFQRPEPEQTQLRPREDSRGPEHYGPPQQ